LTYALYASPAVHIEEKVLLDNQEEAKNGKQQLLRQKKMLACQKEYGDKLTFIEMANFPAFWSTKAVASREYNKLEGHTAKLNAVKDQIRIRVIGFGWKDLHHPWSKNGKVYTADEPLKYLVDILVPEQAVRGIPEVPTMDLPPRKVTPRLGQRTVDVEMLDERYEEERQSAINEAVAMRAQLENEGVIDKHEKLQPARPDVDEKLIGVELEILYSYDEPDGSTKKMWCQGIVVAI